MFNLNFLVTMKSKFLAMALSAVALTACNNDEVLEVNRGRGISFQVATEASTRATATTTNTIEKFKVWGFTGNPAQTLMNGIEVSKNGNEWSYGDAIFWPESDVDFYSVSPSDVAGVSISNSEQKITDFTVNTDQTSQVDLLYAVNKGEKKADHESKAVSINFRHALSQIVFKAKNTNERLKVSIKDVKVVNVVKGGDFTYPTNSTTTQNTSESGTIETSTQGKWQLLSGNGSTETYAAGTNTAGVELKTKNQVYDLTTTTGTGDSKVYTGALFLMPQDLEPWNIETDKGNDKGGSYFLVNCQLKNVSGNGDEVQFWPSEADGYAYVAIPTSDIKWEQGKKYIYTFIFGEGGGYVPPVDPEDPDEEPENPGKPVLVPITFDVTVDDFINGGEFDIDMIQKGEDGE